MSNKYYRIIIAGGGTGGHIFPAIAIAQAVMRHQPEAVILFVGANGKMEMEKVPQAGFKIIGLDIVGFNRSNLFKNIFLPFKIIKSLSKAKSILKDFQPNIVVGVGGYASFPMLRAAQKMNIPTLIQEQNSRAGKSNIMLSKNAKIICTAYEGMEKYFSSDAHIVLTGNPVREQIKDIGNQPNSEQDFNLPSSAKVIFIVGGSLGASSINKAIEMHSEEILKEDYVHIFWQTGKLDYQRLSEKFKDNPRIRIFDFIKNIEDIYKRADVIISRAGAMAISELCIVAKPVIFVPYPFAAEDHQTVNANYLVDRQAAIRISDAEVEEKLLEELLPLINNEKQRNTLSSNIKDLAIIDADERIYQELRKYLNP